MLEKNPKSKTVTYNEFISELVQDSGGVGRVIGARILILDIEPVDDISARAKAAGLHAVVYDRNVPKPTEGIVLGVGGDPLVQEEVKIGDHVFFGKFAGHHVYEQGREYRSLEFQEVTRVKSRVFYGWKEEVK